MATIDNFRKMALALPGAEEKLHFDLPSFRVKNKIFATIHVKHNRAMIKLSPITQPVFCGADKAAIYPVPGTWGAGGATFFDLDKGNDDILQHALLTAWAAIAPKKMVEEYKKEHPDNGI